MRWLPIAAGPACTINTSNSSIACARTCGAGICSRSNTSTRIHSEARQCSAVRWFISRKWAERRAPSNSMPANTAIDRTMMARRHAAARDRHARWYSQTSVASRARNAARTLSVGRTIRDMRGELVVMPRARKPGGIVLECQRAGTTVDVMRCSCQPGTPGYAHSRQEASRARCRLSRRQDRNGGARGCALAHACSVRGAARNAIGSRWPASVTVADHPTAATSRALACNEQYGQWSVKCPP